VPVEVFDRERKRLAAYISNRGRPLVETRRVAHGVLAEARHTRP
jgi:hypothetical protein